MPYAPAGRRSSTPWFVIAVTIGSITLVRLPVLLNAKGLIDPCIIAIFTFAVGWNLQHQPRGSFAGRALLIPLLYTLVVGVALFRGGVDEAYGSLSSAAYQSAICFLFLLFGATLITSASTRHERIERLKAIALAPVAYILVNVVLHLAGAENSISNGATQGTPATLLSSIGISIGRSRFPLATSINLFAIIVSAALVAVVVLRFRSPPRISRFFTWLAIIASIYCLLLSDSRAALLIAVIAIVLILTGIRIPAAVMGGIIPLLPILVLVFIGLVTDLHLSAALSRGSVQTEEFATGTGRLFIWQEAWEFLRHLQFEELYGWGAAGHFVSGASYHWAPTLSASPEAPKEFFTHNVALQMVFDTGYLGLGVLVAAIWVTWSRLQHFMSIEKEPAVLALMGVVIVIVLSGATEVSPTYYTQEALLEILLIMGAGAGLTRLRGPTQSPKQPTYVQHRPVAAQIV